MSARAHLTLLGFKQRFFPFFRQARVGPVPAKGTPLSLTLALALAATAAVSTANTAHSDATHPEAVAVEPESKAALPSKLHLNNNSFSLVGLGVRQVTMLNFSVYVVGLYADAKAIAGIKGSPQWIKGYSPEALMTGSDNAFYMKDFVRRPGTELTLLIQPVRATTGTHLRQGFTRFLNARVVKDIKDGVFESEQAKKDAEEAVGTLEAKFPVGPIPKNARLYFTKTANNELRVQYNDRELALIKSEWLSQRFFEGYLAHEKPISDKFRKNVALAFEKLIHDQ
ncbi:chalcone-flavanone isomerase-domain-containing protein [Obelidium mucronatum]|nr:chalcone-flavanone isomerase-domain-containing protein [Obelidium mucronatum]